MNLNWEWANRCLRAIQLLAIEWEVNVWTSKLEKEISHEHQAQFAKYHLGSAPVEWRLEDLDQHLDQQVPATFDEIFDAWAGEDNFLAMYFNVFDDT